MLLLHIFVCLVLVILAKPDGFNCAVPFVLFERDRSYDGHLCPTEHIIQNVRYRFDSMCLLLCSKQLPCIGVFLDADVKKCLTCSSVNSTRNTSTSSIFYRRKMNITANPSNYVTSLSGINYQFINETVDWFSAKNHCLSNGGDLVSIKSADENDFIIQNVLPAVDLPVFTSGLGIGGHAETFYWADGSNVSAGYTNWEDGQPSPPGDKERCLWLTPPNWTWTDTACRKFANSVCEFKN